jgi:hypothetical protein
MRQPRHPIFYAQWQSLHGVLLLVARLAIQLPLPPSVTAKLRSRLSDGFPP